MAMFGKRMMMTLVGGLSLFFVIACGTVSTAAAPGSYTPEAPVSVAAPAVGDNFLTGAYCAGVDIPFLKAFTALLEREGQKGYWEFIKQFNVPCYDTRVHQIDPVRATLVKMLWTFTLPNGKQYEMWEATDERGSTAYTWTPHRGQEV